jgi:hypothetical protein
MDENRVPGKFFGLRADPVRPQETPYNQNPNREPEQKLWSTVVDFGLQFWLQGSFSAHAVLRTVRFFSRFKRLSCSKLAQIWTGRGQLLVKNFHLL